MPIWSVMSYCLQRRSGKILHKRYILQLETCIPKETEWHPYGCCHDNISLCWLRLKFPVLSWNKSHLYPNQSNDGSEDNMGTMSVPSKTLCVTLEVAIFSFLTEREMSWKSCYGNSTMGVILFLLWCICGGKFQEHCFSFSRDIVSSVLCATS